MSQKVPKLAFTGTFEFHGEKNTAPGGQQEVASCWSIVFNSTLDIVKERDVDRSVPGPAFRDGGTAFDVEVGMDRESEGFLQAVRVPDETNPVRVVGGRLVLGGVERLAGVFDRGPPSRALDLRAKIRCF